MLRVPCRADRAGSLAVPRLRRNFPRARVRLRIRARDPEPEEGAMSALDPAAADDNHVVVGLQGWFGSD